MTRARRESRGRNGALFERAAVGHGARDYSEGGDAWNTSTHDHARSRAYRWGEDGLGGICDEKQRLCFAITLWNEHDPILKERLYGSPTARRTWEDVKEYYFYIDSTRTHSYMKVSVQVPAAGVSLPRPDRDKPGTVAGGVRV